MSSKTKGECATCGRRYPINKDGKIYHHYVRGSDLTCLGSYEDPAEGSVKILPPEPEPTWFERNQVIILVVILVAAALSLGIAIGSGLEGGWTR